MSTATPDYCFVVQDARGDAFELEIVPSDDRARQHFQSVWQRLSLAVEGLHKIERLETPPGWVSWQPWKWCEDRRAAYRPRQQFVAWCGSNQAGMLNVWAGFDSVHEAGKKTLYIEHVAAAPGNLDTPLWKRRYRHVGVALMAFAVKLSGEQTLEGRLSLHAADDVSLGFYRWMNEKFGPTLFFPERADIIGPTPHGPRSDAGKTYLETTPDGAARLLEGYRRA